MTRHLPSQTETLLLQAVLLPGPEAVAAWRTWRQAVDFDAIDYGSQYLLPLLHANLRRLGVADPILAKYEGIHKLYWYRNQLLMQQLERVLQDFSAHGVPAILIKGAALNALGLFKPGMRPMIDLDVVVPLDRALEAAEILERAGWRREFRAGRALTAGDLRFSPDGIFSQPHDLELELHWESAPQFFRGSASQALWQKAERATWRGQPFLLLNPADQLLLVCAHGGMTNPVSPIRWVSDALALMAANPIDWDYFDAQATRHRLVFVVRGMLRYLAERFSAPIPMETLAKLDRSEIGFIERWQWEALQVPEARMGLFQVIGRHVGALYGFTGGEPRWSDWFDYIHYIWATRSTRRDPGSALKWLGHRLGRSWSREGK
jgi:putative nucleotidyltransferase-like protein